MDAAYSLTVPFNIVENYYFPDDVVVAEDSFDPEVCSDYLFCLSSKDRDIFRLYYWDKISQSVIANLFGTAQGDISYRLRKCILRCFRVRYLKNLIDCDYVTNVLSLTDFENKVLRGFVLCSTQLEIAELVGKSQSTISKCLITIRRKCSKFHEDENIKSLKKLLEYDTDNQ